MIDETDRMIEANHFPELRSLIEKVNSNPEKSKERQNFVFSATLSLVHQPPSYVMKSNAMFENAPLAWNDIYLVLRPEKSFS